MTKHKKESYVSVHPLEYFQRTFFGSFHYNFWMHKANALLQYIKNQEKIQELRFNEDKDSDEYILENLKMEFHMMTFHSSESLLLIILSAIHNPTLPWVWLSRCKLGTQIDLFQKLASHGLQAFIEKPEVWLRDNLYPSINEKHENYEKSIKSSSFVAKYIQELAKEYMEHEEYNSYKHGLRGFPGRGKLQVIDEQTGEKMDFKEMDIITFLEFQEEHHGNERKLRIKDAVKGYDLERDLRIIRVNSSILLNLFEKKRIDLKATSADPKKFGYYLFHDWELNDVFKFGLEGTENILRKISM